MRICSAMVAALLLTGPAQAQEPAHWRLVEEWRVGGAVDGALSLNNVRAVLPMADGRIVILEGKDQQVHILSNRGVPIRTIGRRGAGPGEFQNATGLLVMPDGRIMVHDVSNARLTILAANGDLVRTVTHVPWGEDTQWDARFGTDGHLDESGSIARMDPAMGIATSSQGIRRLWNADFTQADTTRAPACANLPEATYQDIVWQGPSPLMRGMFQSVPYQFVLMPRHAHASARDGTLWIGLYPEYQTIKRITFGTCNVVATVVLRGPAIAVPSGVLGEIRAIVGRSGNGATGPMAPDPGRVRRTLPYFEAMTTDALDRLWVERLVPGTVKFTTQSATGERRFDIYSPQGKLLADANVPPRMSAPRSGRPVAITADRVYAIATDQDDVPYLVSYRIMRS